MAQARQPSREQRREQETGASEEKPVVPSVAQRVAQPVAQRGAHAHHLDVRPVVEEITVEEEPRNELAEQTHQKTDDPCEFSDEERTANRV